MNKKIIILGNSSGIPALIESIRIHDVESDITLVSPDGQWPYDRNLLVPLLAKEISPSQALIKSAEFYAQNKVEAVFDKKVTKINFRKNQITLGEKEAVLDYDILVVSSLPERKLPDIKGVNKEGVWALGQLAAVSQFIKELPFIETLVIQSSSSFGLKMAEAALKREKEVILLTDSTLKTSSAAPSEGIRCVEDNPLMEVLGETDVRAVRLKSGKVLACDAVFFGELSPHFRLFQDTAVSVQERIVVNGELKSSVDNVYAFDEAIEGASWDYLEKEDHNQTIIEQARLLASQITGAPAQAQTQTSDNA